MMNRIVGMLGMRIAFAPEDGGGSGGGGSSVPTGGAASAPSSPAAPVSSVPSSPTSGASPSGEAQARPSWDASFGPDEEDSDPFDMPGDVLGAPAIEVPATPPASLPAAAQPPAPTAPQPQAVVPPEAPPAQPVPPAQQAPQQPTSEAPSAGREGPLFDVSDPGQLGGFFDVSNPAVVATIAKDMFQLSAEEIQAFEADPAAALPALGAKVYIQAMRSMLNLQARMMPAILQKHQQVTGRNTESEGKFFQRWPALSAPQHRETILRYARVMRQANPRMPFDQMVEELGPMMHMVLKIPQTAQQTAQPPQPHAPRNPAPFVPAQGAAPVAIPQQNGLSDWDMFGLPGET